MTYTIEKCQCGSASCNYWAVTGPESAFFQGTGFRGEKLAQSVADFLNKEVENDAAVQIAEEAFRAGFAAGHSFGLFAYSGKREPCNPHSEEAHRAWNAYEPSDAVKELTR